jgi:Kef-type K+ transport system membrane component KefB
MGIFSPLTAKYLAGPVFRWYLEDRFARFKHVSNILLMVFVLCAFLSIAGFAGASVLYGAFLAGTFLSALPCIHPDAPFMVFDREHGESDPDKTPTFVHTFEKYFLGAQTYILQPMFFASIGFAIPFRKLWTGQAIWHGIVFTLLMLFGKVGTPAGLLYSDTDFDSSSSASSSPSGTQSRATQRSTPSSSPNLPGSPPPFSPSPWLLAARSAS